MLHVKSLSFGYNASTVFAYPDFQVNKGDFLLVLGQSGSGKTTLLHLLAGFLKAKEGSIQLVNQDLSALSPSARDLVRKKHIGLVFQKHHFVKSLSVEENLMLGLQLSGKKNQQVDLQKELDSLGIVHRRKAKPSELSQGELQRTAILRATLHKPDLVLADEPTSALDDESCEAVAALLKKQSQQNEAGLIVVTHDARLKPFSTHTLTL